MVDVAPALSPVSDEPPADASARSDQPTEASLAVRRMRFEWPEDQSAEWTPHLPELACVANAVSLLMPHAEPYVVASVRRALPHLEEPLRSEAEAWMGQEAAHHGAHLRLNRILIAQQPGLDRLDRQMASTFTWLGRRSERFGLAYAAGFEALAFIAARWVDKRSGELFRGADVVPTTLFLWHLAEEVEHRSVAYDVHQARGGGRLRLAGAQAVATLVMAWFTVLGTIVGLWQARRVWRPGAHIRMVGWSLSFLFDLLPAQLGVLLAGHHPSRQAAPSYLSTWLDSYDPETRTMPAWSMSVTEV